MSTKHHTVEECVNAIEQIVGEDVGRHVQALVEATAGDLYKAAADLALATNPRVAIITGFYIPKAKCAETDGPVGAAQLAGALDKNGIPVSILTDSFCRNAVTESLNAAISERNAINVYALDALERPLSEEFTHVISIERAGPSQSGRIFNMMAEDVTDTTPDFHASFLDGPWKTKVAIGDGGNEIGMGSLPGDLIFKNIKYGEKIACVTPCDFLIVAGVSNWGAWGLMAALSLIRPDWEVRPFLEPQLSENTLHACVDRGPAVDGVSGQRTYTVDGKDWDTHCLVLRRILQICDSVNNEEGPV